jgi:hypothetical protein
LSLIRKRVFQLSIICQIEEEEEEEEEEEKEDSEEEEWQRRRRIAASFGTSRAVAQRANISACVRVRQSMKQQPHLAYYAGDG